MNEFYEAVSNLFEELRCDSGEREYTVQPEEWKEAEKNLKQIQKKYTNVKRMIEKYAR